MEPTVTYKIFHELAQVEMLITVLTGAHIPYEVTEDRASLDSLYGDKHLDKIFYVKLLKEDFSRADVVLNEITSHQLNQIDPSHYLFSFSGEELFEVLSKPDEWNELDYQLAQQILEQRGEEVNDAVIEKLKEKRVAEMRKPLKGSLLTIITGYVLALLAGVLGVFIGMSYYTAKKTLPNGEVVPVHDQSTRSHGLRISIIGSIVFTIALILKISFYDSIS